MGRQGSFRLINKGVLMKRPKTVETIRKEAEALLKRCKVKSVPVVVEDIAQALGARIRYSPFDGELAGMLIRDDTNTVIGVNSLHHINRQRFTIAHECGHLVMHKGIDVHIDRSFRVNRRDQISSKAIDPEEIEANRFAAEILMPHKILVKDLVEYAIDVENEEELKVLAEKYKVSLQAMTLRITNILQEVF